jgi:uncharacterized protein YecA (UPF0149 family)
VVDEGVKDGVLLLQGQMKDIRSRFGHLVGDEKQDGEEHTIDGGWCSHEMRWTAKEVTDGGDS